MENEDMPKTSTTNSIPPYNRETLRLLAGRILRLSDNGTLTLDFLREINDLLISFTRCHQVETVFLEQNKIFHCLHNSDTPKVPVATASRLQGDIVTALIDLVETDIEATILKKVLEQSFSPEDNAFSDFGSYRNHDSLIESSEKKTKKRPLFLAVFPIIINSQPCGLLILSDEKADVLDSATVDLFEYLVMTLETALLHNLSQFDLRERVKELTCMYNIASLTSQPDMPIKDLLKHLVELLPQAYLYPDITAARITFDEMIFQTEGFQQNEFMQTAEIRVGSQVRGHVEVCLLEERPELDEGPFLLEERKLLDSVVHEISLIIERRHARKLQTQLQEQLRHADRLATIGQLAAGVAHELNEPLTAVLGFSQLAKENPNLPTQVIGDLNRIEGSALHARDIVRKLLFFAKQIPPDRHDIHINRIIGEVISFFRPRFQKENITLLTELQQGLPIIQADESQLRQILINLIVNASHAMPQGGTLTIRTFKQENNLILSVADTGEGMSEDVKKQIFLPFFTTKDIDQGTGLGLSVVHGLIKAHHGDIIVNSSPGKGSDFIVSLPINGLKHGKEIDTTE